MQYNMIHAHTNLCRHTICIVWLAKPAYKVSLNSYNLLWLCFFHPSLLCCCLVLLPFTQRGTTPLLQALCTGCTPTVRGTWCSVTLVRCSSNAISSENHSVTQTKSSEAALPCACSVCSVPSPLSAIWLSSLSTCGNTQHTTTLINY